MKNQKRQDLLKAILTEENKEQLELVKLNQQDSKFLKRRVRDLETELEDLEDALVERLSSPTPIDKSTVEVSFAQLKETQAKLELYKEFQNLYF